MLAHLGQFGVSKGRRQLDYEADKVNDANPSRCFWIVFHPSFKEVLNIISCNDTIVGLLGIFKSLNNGSHRQVHNEPSNNDNKGQEVCLGEGMSTSSRREPIP